MITKSTLLICLMAPFIVLLAVLPVAASDLVMEPTVNIITGQPLLVEEFDSVNAWENYSSPSGVMIGVEDGAYRASTMNPGFVWGLNAQEHSDVVLEVSATPMSVFVENGFGVMCRADTSNNGDGYYFMVTGAGYYSIRVGMGDSVVPLVDWTMSEAVRDGIDTNTIRAVCIDDYLALYANDQLLAEVTDTTYSTGYAGLAIAATESGNADVIFDDLTIWEAVAIDL